MRNWWESREKCNQVNGRVIWKEFLQKASLLRVLLRKARVLFLVHCTARKNWNEFNKFPNWANGKFCFSPHHTRPPFRHHYSFRNPINLNKKIVKRQEPHHLRFTFVFLFAMGPQWTCTGMFDILSIKETSKPRTRIIWTNTNNNKSEEFTTSQST